MKILLKMFFLFMIMRVCLWNSLFLKFRIVLSMKVVIYFNILKYIKKIIIFCRFRNYLLDIIVFFRIMLRSCVYKV